MPPDSNSFCAIWDIVRCIPEGRVSTYGRIARLAGNPRWARVVGYAMRACRDGSVPCHRVLHRDGSLSAAFGPGPENRQRLLLEKEGVPLLPDGRVELARCLWP